MQPLPFRFNFSRRIFGIFSIAIGSWVWISSATAGLAQQADLESLQTVAEQSDFRRTSLSADVASFVEQCCTAPHVTPFQFGSTVEGRPMVGAIACSQPYNIGDRDDRLRIILLGNIHSGECDGKEALLAILRQLAREPGHAWLQNMVILFAPNYNADGNDRIGLDHRPGQGGPELGMGVRENAQQLDLNRDFVKLESPEAKALIGLINRVDPHIFIDCHTTNGSLHQYGLTYDVPHHPASPESIRNYMRSQFMPEVTRRLEAEGMLTFYYGNFNRDKTRWESYGYEPRYSTDYIGMRGRLGILSESYSHSTFRDRVIASEKFVSACLQFAHENAQQIDQLVAETDRQFVERAAAVPQSIVFPVDARMVPFDEQVTIRAWDDQNQPADYLCDFVANYEPTRSVNLPAAYVIPAEFTWQVDRLRMHGIVVERLQQATELEVAVFQIGEIKRSSRPFQGHAMNSLLGNERNETRSLPAGTYIVRTAQPLGRLAACLLEPTSVDGLAAWNFFDEHIELNGDFPVLRILQPRTLPTETVAKIEPKNRLTIERIYGPDSRWTARTSAPRWMPDGRAYLQDWDGWVKRELIMTVDTGAMSTPPHNETRSLREAIRSLEGSGASADLAAADRTISPSGRSAYLTTPNAIARWQFEPNTVQLIAHSPTAIDRWWAASDDSVVAFVSENNLFVQSGESEPWQVTQDGSPSLINGSLDWVYQEELYGRGDYQGTWIHPAGKYVAFLRFDESAVPAHLLPDHSTFAATPESSPYPNAGDPLPKVTLHVADPQQKTVITADLSAYGDEELLISWVGWDASGERLGGERLGCYIQDRGQTWLDVALIDPATGQLTRLLRDQTPASIRRPPPPVWMRDGRFLLLSPRDGFNHLYLFAEDGTQLQQLTSGPWQVSDLHGVSADESTVFISGYPSSALRTQVMAVDLQTSDRTVLTDEQFDHQADFNSTCDHFFDRTSSVDTEPVVQLRDAHGQLVRSIVVSADERLKYYTTQPAEFFEIPTRDGGVMDAMLIRPTDFDPVKRYPVIVHVYSGPQSPTVRDAFRGTNFLWHQMMAQHGYAIWMCDNRSSSRRGQAATWNTYGELGKRELEDISDGLDWLTQRHSWVDSGRIGIWGWSYGGYMTSYAMTHSERFKAGVAGAPVTDWRNYDAIYTERLMKHPDENAAGYDASSVVAAADQLHGRILLVHGTMDDNVHPGNTLQLAAALQAAGKPFEMMLYPSNRHSITESAQRLHCWQTITQFFLDHL